ncbi:zinc transporter ZIP1-like [Ptychodera flava]|uniref:zinc transporter ZIP1-like n=1 Tax=Ptychodera flava TaxID=63121 RepID=UPI003969CDA9
MDLICAQTIAMAGLFLVAGTSGLVPIYLGNCIPSSVLEQLFSFLNFFAGGVILAMSMLHMLPEVNQELQHASEYIKLDPGFPIAEFLVCVGIFLMLLLEQFLSFSAERCAGAEDTDDTDVPLKPTESNDSTYYGAAGQCVQNIVSSSNEGQAYRSHIRSCMFFIALCTHGIFEGVVLGLLPSSAEVLLLFTGIACHEGPVSFSFAATMKRSGLRSPIAVLLVCLHALIFPIGIGIGIGLGSSTGKLRNLFSGIMQGLATGMLLYLTFFEILPAAITEKKKRALKTLVMIFGFAAITALYFIL